MFQGLKNVAWTLKALKQLCEGAMTQAEAEGLSEVGAEHFLLSAFDLPDGTARRSFEPFGIDKEALRAAIERHYAEALKAAGMGGEAMPPPAPITRPTSPWAGLPSSASGLALLDRLAEKGPAGEPLCGADVVLATLSARRGTVPRVLASLRIDPEALAAFARAERDAHLSSL